jgi:CheY-like chemotaxis protein
MSRFLQLLQKEKKAAASAARPAKEKEAFQTDPAPAPNQSTVGRNRRILVVDDNQTVLKAFETKLKVDGFAVVTSSNSATVASTVEQSKAELIVLDINFPPTGGMQWTGFTVMQWLRRFPELATIPVILISGEGSCVHKDKALAAGAIAFFEKPVVYKELVAAIVTALGDSSSQA